MTKLTVINLAIFCLLLFAKLNSHAEVINKSVPPGLSFPSFSPIPSIQLQQPNMLLIAAEDSLEALDGKVPKIARIAAVSINADVDGTWRMNSDGSRLWQVRVMAPGAKGVILNFNNLKLPPGSSLYFYTEDQSHIAGPIESGMISNPTSYTTGILPGDQVIIEFFQPAGTLGKLLLSINEAAWVYRDATIYSGARDFGSSASCMININCPEGTNWQNQKRSVARILLKVGNSYGWCTGSVVNTVNESCTPYFLTAYHCGQGASANDVNQWVFYFNFEASGCSNPASNPGYNYTVGAVVRSHSNDNGGDTGSDFMLVQFNNAIPQGWNVYYSGWDASGSATNSGVMIHHPVGDIKKISTYGGGIWSTSWGGTVSGTHWAIYWVQTTSGRSVSQGGSSGAPLFNSSGRIIGTLTGGSSSCSSPGNPDLHGKFSFHWASNGSASNRRLRDWLDPGNTNTTVKNGTFAPCGASAPVAEFTANQRVGCAGMQVIFSDQSSGNPTSWSWSFPGGTPSSSTAQNPTVTYSAPGVFNVSLTATNANGSNTMTKTGYITVFGVTGSTPLSEGFEGTTFPPQNWGLSSSNSDSYTWVRTTAAGGFGASSASTVMDNFSSQSSIAGTWDALHTPVFNFSQVTGGTLTFDVAYARYNATYSDSLAVMISTNCGASYTSLWGKGGTNLATAPDNTNSFVPAANQWRTETITIPSAYFGNPYVRFAFVNLSGWGNNIYLDNINLLTSSGTAPTAAFSANPVSICTGGNVQFSDQSTGNPTSWSWSFPGGTPSTSTVQNPVVTYSTTGFYSVTLTVSNSNGNNTLTQQNLITVSTGPTGSFTTNPVSCHGGADGAAVVVLNGGTPPYSYLWSNGATSAVVQNLAAGVYSVTVQDGSGCTVSGNATITQPNPLGANVSSNPPSGGGSNGFISVTPTGGTAPYSFVWSTGATTSTLSNLSSGTYSFTISDSKQCTWSQSVTLTGTTCAVPANVRTTHINPVSARLRWEVVTGAEKYRIRGRIIGTTTWTILNINNPTSNFLDVASLAPGTTYEWQIRTICDEAQGIASGYSSLVTFTTICVAPNQTTTINITSTSARLTWNPVPKAHKYEVTIRRIGIPGWFNFLTAGSENWYDISGLTAGANYEWAVRNHCDQSGVYLSGYSPMTTFQTSASRLSAEERTLGLSMEVLPNPTTGLFRLSISGETGETGLIKVTDLTGKVLLNQQLLSDTPDMSQWLDLSQYSKGIYFVHLETHGHHLIKKVIKI